MYESAEWLIYLKAPHTPNLHHHFIYFIYAEVEREKKTIFDFNFCCLCERCGRLNLILYFRWLCLKWWENPCLTELFRAVRPHSSGQLNSVWNVHLDLSLCVCLWKNEDKNCLSLWEMCPALQTELYFVEIFHFFMENQYLSKFSWKEMHLFNSLAYLFLSHLNALDHQIS